MDRELGDVLLILDDKKARRVAQQHRSITHSLLATGFIAAVSLPIGHFLLGE